VLEIYLQNHIRATKIVDALAAINLLDKWMLVNGIHAVICIARYHNYTIDERKRTIGYTVIELRRANYDYYALGVQPRDNKN
jgi:hypothetical protein